MLIAVYTASRNSWLAEKEDSIDSPIFAKEEIGFCAQSIFVQRDLAFDLKPNRGAATFKGGILNIRAPIHRQDYPSKQR